MFIQIEERALARYENLYAHAVAVIRLHLSKKNNPLLTFTFLKHFLGRILNYLLLLRMPYRLDV